MAIFDKEENAPKFCCVCLTSKRFILVTVLQGNRANSRIDESIDKCIEASLVAHQ